MARPNKAWPRDDRGGDWYAKVGGRKVKVADAGATQTEANRRLREMLVEHERDRGRERGPSRPVVRVAGLVRDFLLDCRGQVERGEMSPETERSYRMNLRFFGPAMGIMEAEAVRPHHVKAFLDGRPTWGSTTRFNVLTAVKRVFRWAKTDGRIEANPLAEMPKPKPQRREAVPTPEGAAAALAGCAAPEFTLYLAVLHGTGCRPGEARAVEAADLDFARGLWRRKGKTTRATGRERVVHVPPGLLGALTAQARRYPTGPLLRNTVGEPWTQTAINTQMRRLRARIGAGKELVPYGMRHRFATDALLAGVDAATVATLLGHASLKMLMERYAHLIDHDGHLKGALGRVRGSLPEQE